MARPVASPSCVVMAAVLWAGAGHATEEVRKDNAVSAPPIHQGPIWDGRQHQPRVGDVLSREQARGQPPGVSDRTGPDADELYRRIIKQSEDDHSSHSEPSK